MMLWFVPAALAGEEMTAPAERGVVYKVLEAAKAAE